MTTQSISTFMRSPLVAWVKTIQSDGLDYKSLCNGDFLFNIWSQIDPKPSQHGFMHSRSEDMVSRLRNLNFLLTSIKTFYEEVLGQFLILQMPDVVKLSKSLDEDANMDELNNLLLLILGSAVQCEHKEVFIENIKTLDLDAQHTMVEYIKQVTDNPESIWSTDWNELSHFPTEEQEHMYSVLTQNIKTLVQQRDEIMQKLVAVVIEYEMGTSLDGSTDRGLLSPCSSGADRPHLMVELADVKSRLRKLHQEVEEKNEMLSELKEELEDNKDTSNRLRQENLELVQDSRTAKAYRDEIDILKERVHKVDRLESEIQRYKDKMNELDFYRSRVEEVREDNRILNETKIMLEEQLDSCRKRTEHLTDLEADNLKHQSKTNELLMMQDNDKDRIQNLLEENAQLHFEKKASLEELSRVQSELTHLRTQNSPVKDLNLHDQLNSDAQTRVLHLELENNRLRMEVDNSKVASPSEEMSNKEAEYVEQVHESLQKIVSLETQIQEFKLEQEQTAERVASLEAKRHELDANVGVLEAQVKIYRANELKFQVVEQNASSTNTENQRLHRSIESLQAKLHAAQQESLSLENENLKLNTTLESLKLTVRKFHELEKENTNLEAENHKLEQEKKHSEKDNKRLRNAVEIKDSTIEDLSSRASSLERENKQLTKERENLSYLTVRTREQEKENRDLVQQVTVAKKTLAVLRQDLVSEKIKCQQLRSEVERLTALLIENQNSKEEKETNTDEMSRSTITLAEEEEISNRLEDSNLELTRSQETTQELIQTSGSNVQSSSQPLEVETLRSNITDLERKIVLIDEENQNLKNQTSTLKDQNAALNSQVEVFQQRISSVNKQNTELHSKLAKLEVEATLLKSQNSTLTSQSSNYQCQVSALEDRGKLLQNSIVELQDIQKSLLDDHETLQKLHSQLSLDYENLSANYTSLKAQHRHLKVEHGIIKDKLQATVICQEEVTKLREVLNESPKADHKSLLTLKMQHAQLKEHIKSLKEENDRMHGEYKALQESKKSLKTENNELKLKYTKLQGELAESKDHLASLEVEVSRLNNYCEALNQANISLSDEHTSLMQHVSNILAEYHSLLARFIEEHEDSLQGENYLSEKLKDLSWQRKKLEQKFTERAQQNAKLFRRPRYQSVSAQNMRRTKSQQLPNSKSCCNDLNEDLEKEINLLRRRERSSFDSFGENDEIPVRDVGPLPTEDSNANLNPENQLPSSNFEPGPIPTDSNGLPARIPHSTTVENYTTVNFITNTSPEHQVTNSPSRDSPTNHLGSGGISRNASFRSSNRPRSAIFCSSSDGSSTPVFGSIMPRTGLRCSRNYGKSNGHHPSPTTGNLNCSVGEAGVMMRARGSPENERFRPQSTGNSPAGKDKNKSSVWYEYGCV